MNILAYVLIVFGGLGTGISVGRPTHEQSSAVRGGFTGLLMIAGAAILFGRLGIKDALIGFFLVGSASIVIGHIILKQIFK